MPQNQPQSQSGFAAAVGGFLQGYGTVRQFQNDAADRRQKDRLLQMQQEDQDVRLNEAGYDRITMPSVQAPPDPNAGFVQRVGSALSAPFRQTPEPSSIVMKTHQSAHDADVANQQDFLTRQSQATFAHEDLMEGMKAVDARKLEAARAAAEANVATIGAGGRVRAAEIAAGTPDWTAVDDTDPTTGLPRKMKLDRHSGRYDQIGGGKASGSRGGTQGAASSLREMLDADENMSTMEPNVVPRLTTMQELAATQAAASAHTTATGTGGLVSLAGQALGAFGGQHVLEPDIAEYDRNARSFGMQSTQALKGRQSDQKVTRDIQLSRVFAANKGNPNVLRDAQGTRRNLILMAAHDNPDQIATLSPRQRDRLRALGADIPAEGSSSISKPPSSGGSKITVNGKTFIIPD